MRWFWFGAAALLAWLCAAEIFAAWRESNIADEPLELAAGYSYLKTGDFRLNPEHPPLAKMLAALPLLLFHPVLPVDHPFWTSADEGGFGILFFGRNEDRLDGMLFAARLVSIFLTVCLGLAMALWARKMFGYGAALLALALYCFDPAIIAHGHYVKNDVPVTLFCFVACIAWCAFLNRPGVAPLALAGVTVGIAIATKFFGAFPGSGVRDSLCHRMVAAAEGAFACAWRRFGASGSRARRGRDLPDLRHPRVDPRRGIAGRQSCGVP